MLSVEHFGNKYAKGKNLLPHHPEAIIVNLLVFYFQSFIYIDFKKNI